MRRLLPALVVLLALLVPVAGLAAQEQKPQKAKDWETHIDEAFKKYLLDPLGYVPFYNIGPLLGISAEPTPLRDDNGKIIYEVDANGEPVYEKDEDGKIKHNEAGEPIPKPAYVNDPRGNPATTQVFLVVLWLIVGALIFTIFMRFVNLRLFGHAINVVRGKYSNPDDAGEVSHFQALSAALSATVGLGNIAGVAIAVSLGGPGATLWMIIAGLFGMTLKFTECTLGQTYRKIDAEGRVSGGPMHYLKDGLAEKGLGGFGAVLSVIFIIFCVGGSLAGGNAFQVKQSLGVVAERMEFFATTDAGGMGYGFVYGLAMAFLVAIVIIGGIKRIAQTAERIVPTMCGIYILAAITILLANFSEIPAAFGKIIGGAFDTKAMYGGVIGTLVLGFQRAAFSNEAGIGSAAIAHSAARTPYPVREGIVALLEPFIDTVVVCTMTALVIVITGSYNPEVAGTFGADTTAAMRQAIVDKEGAMLTNYAFQSVPFLANWFPWILMVAVMLFAFSTMISWSYYGERCWTSLFGQRASLSYKILFLVFVFLGSVISANNVLEFGDLMILCMAFPNIMGLYFLGGVVKRQLASYEIDRKAGKFQVYK
ncbi:MAG: alanine/glycine:cation symporter family protein [Planctomycetota bacterium]|jgi:AGCS family alanine or glycine:cation symporter